MPDNVDISGLRKTVNSFHIIAKHMSTMLWIGDLFSQFMYVCGNHTYECCRFPACGFPAGCL